MMIDYQQFDNDKFVTPFSLFKEDFALCQPLVLQRLIIII